MGKAVLKKRIARKGCFGLYDDGVIGGDHWWRVCYELSKRKPVVGMIKAERTHQAVKEFMDGTWYLQKELS